MRVWPSPQPMQSAQSLPLDYSTQASVRPRALPYYAYTQFIRSTSRVHCTHTKTTAAAHAHAHAFGRSHHAARLPNLSSALHRNLPPSAAAMTTSTPTRHQHAGHCHHHHDNTFLLSKNKNDAGVRITRVGLYVNLGMAISKGFGGYVFNSQGEMDMHSQLPVASTDTLHQLSSPTPFTALPTSSATS